MTDEELEAKARKRAEQIEQLFALANSTSFPEEAEAALQKASELMLRYSIDESMFRQHSGSSEKPIKQHEVVPGPYAKAKALVLSTVARANGCRVIQLGNLRQQNQECMVFGYAGDVERTCRLFVQVLLNGEHELVRAKFADDSGENAKSFAQGFWMSYYSRIALRLREAQKTAEQESHVPGVALVLRGRDEDTDSLVNETFPKLSKSVVSSGGNAGGRAGWEAGGRVGLNEGVGSGRKGELV